MLPNLHRVKAKGVPFAEYWENRNILEVALGAVFVVGLWPHTMLQRRNLRVAGNCLGSFDPARSRQGPRQRRSRRLLPRRALLHRTEYGHDALGFRPGCVRRLDREHEVLG